VEALPLVGILIAIVGGIWLLVVAFRESLLWGLACLVVPIVMLLFVATHWSESKTPFLVQVAGWALFLVGTQVGSNP